MTMLCDRIFKNAVDSDFWFGWWNQLRDVFVKAELYYDLYTKISKCGTDNFLIKAEGSIFETAHFYCMCFNNATV